MYHNQGNRENTSAVQCDLWANQNHILFPGVFPSDGEVVLHATTVIGHLRANIFSMSPFEGQNIITIFTAVLPSIHAELKVFLGSKVLCSLF